ncbi:Plasmodium exported protein, unknown function [Plasmodium vivax]|nr:Plasmodium exported protein, unknown function [Plasmodium vivax]
MIIPDKKKRIVLPILINLICALLIWICQHCVITVTSKSLQETIHVDVLALHLRPGRVLTKTALEKKQGDGLRSKTKEYSKNEKKGAAKKDTRKVPAKRDAKKNDTGKVSAKRGAMKNDTKKTPAKRGAAKKQAQRGAGKSQGRKDSDRMHPKNAVEKRMKQQVERVTSEKKGDVLNPQNVMEEIHKLKDQEKKLKSEILKDEIMLKDMKEKVTVKGKNNMGSDKDRMKLSEREKKHKLSLTKNKKKLKEIEEAIELKKNLLNGSKNAHKDVRGNEKLIKQKMADKTVSGTKHENDKIFVSTFQERETSTRNPFKKADIYIEKKFFSILKYVDDCIDDKSIDDKTLLKIRFKNEGLIFVVPIALFVISLLFLIDKETLVSFFMVLAAINAILCIYIIIKVLKYKALLRKKGKVTFKDYVDAFKSYFE